MFASKLQGLQRGNNITQKVISSIFWENSVKIRSKGCRTSNSEAKIQSKERKSRKLKHHHRVTAKESATWWANISRINGKASCDAPQQEYLLGERGVITLQRPGICEVSERESNQKVKKEVIRA